jgi:hypothetical protein
MIELLLILLMCDHEIIAAIAKGHTKAANNPTI